MNEKKKNIEHILSPVTIENEFHRTINHIKIGRHIIKMIVHCFNLKPIYIKYRSSQGNYFCVKL